MAKVAGIIPARWQSTRFPGKPLYNIAGKPLLQHVWERCRRAKSLDAIIVATDDMRIAEAAFDWGAEVALTSAKHRSGTDRLAEVIGTSKTFSHIINVQGDEPLIDSKLIDRLVVKLRGNPQLQMITAAHPFSDPAEASSRHQVKVVLNARNDALYFSRSQIPFPREASKPVRYLRHQGIYGYTRELLLQFVRWKPSPLERAESLEQLRALENGVTVHVLLTKHGSAGIDTPEDAAAMERILTRSRGKNSRR
jgi:3-deoxy-manno-octulosonate cytidylyltransferase (CMP-KDO synthetase)